MRTKRWTPDSVFSHPCELCPLTTMVADLMPASSPSVSSISSTSNFRRSAQRMYMRRSILAQSQLSVPPAPECTSRYVSLASASPESSASSWRRSPSALKVALDLRQRTQTLFQHRALPHHLFGDGGIGPQAWIFRFRIEFAETTPGSVDVKDA